MIRPQKDETEMTQELPEAKLEREVESEEGIHIAVPLRELIPDDQALYEAMEHFLLASPRRQVDQLGDRAGLRKSADEAKAAGKTVQARIDYESAAKLALYYHDKEDFIRMLELADEMTTEGDSFGQFHLTLLNNVDRAMEIADKYFAGFTPQDRNEVVPPDATAR
jgi:hypothetical protein